jgi:hypothetical protein
VKDTHEGFVALYGLLEKGWVAGSPGSDLTKNCLMTGLGWAVTGGCSMIPKEPKEIKLDKKMAHLLSDATGVPVGELYLWNDSHSKDEVLAAVAECIAQTAPEPFDPLAGKTPLVEEPSHA